MSSRTLGWLLKNWTGGNADNFRGPVELPFNVERFCAQMDSIINELEEKSNYLNSEITSLTTDKEILNTEVKRLERIVGANGTYRANNGPELGGWLEVDHNNATARGGIIERRQQQ